MSLVKDYIRFKNMHKRVLLEKNKSKKLEIISSFFSKEDVEIFEKNNNEQFSLTSWEKNVVKKIITECLKNKIKSSEIEEIPDNLVYHDGVSKKKEILKKVSDHFIQEELNKNLQIKISNEDTYRKLCINAYEDGVLSPDEESNLEWEKDLLNIETTRADEIKKEIEKEFEIAKPKDFIIEIIGQKKDGLTIQEVYEKITKQPYGVIINQGEIRQVIETIAKEEVVYNPKSNKHTLIKNILTKKEEVSEKITYGHTSYSYRLDDTLDRNYPYVIIHTDPQKNHCDLCVNLNNVFFKKFDPEKNLREVIYDGIATHQVRRLTEESRKNSDNFIKIKSLISKKLKDITF